MRMRREYTKKGYRTKKHLEEEKEALENFEPAEGDNEEVAEQKKEQKKKKIELTKEQSFRVWNALLKDVPTDYDFVITSCRER